MPCETTILSVCRCRPLRTALGGRCPEAARDISELRSLLDAFNEAKKTAGLTIVRMLVTGLVLALLAGAFVKLKVFGGGQ